MVKKQAGGRVDKGNRFAFGTRKQYRLTDNLMFGESSTSHYFREVIILGKKPYVVFFRQHWEGANYLIISGTTGKELIMNGIPQVSPNKKHIFTTAYDAGTYFNFSGMELWLFEKEQLTKVFSITPGHDMGAFWRSYWLNNHTILCEVKNGYGEDVKFRYCKIIIQR